MDYIINILNNNMHYILLAFLLLICLNFLVLILVLRKHSKLKKKYEAFMKGNDGESLEDILKKVVLDNKKVKEQEKTNIENISSIQQQSIACYQRMGLIKYDSFRGMAGQLSFALALLNGENSGFIMNCVHTQDGCYTYTKLVVNGKCDVVLCEEEKDALQIALMD